MSLPIFIGWIGRGLVIVLSLVNTRLLIELVDVEGLAAYAIIVSLAAWLTLLNLGMPTAVQNLISSSRANGLDTAKIKSTSFILTCLLFAIFLPLVILFGYLAWRHLLFKYSFVTPFVVIQCCIFMLFSALGLFFTQILYAEHRATVANLYPAINSGCVTIGLSILIGLGEKSFAIATFACFFPMVIIFILGFAQAKISVCFNYDKKIIQQIWNESKGLLLFASLSACTLAIDYIVMSNLLEPYDVAVYSLSSKVFMTVLTLQTVLLSTYWPQISEAMYSGDYNVARGKVFSVLKTGLLVGTVACATLILMLDWIVPILSGGKVKSVSVGLMLAWSLYVLIRIWSDTFSVGVLSVGKTKVINLYIPFQAISSIIAQYIFATHFGVVGIVLGLVLSFLLTAAWILPLQFFKLTRAS